MLKIVDNKIFHDGEKIGWIEGEHVRAENGNKIGYVNGSFVYNEAGHKVAYIHENELVFEDGASAISLEHINQNVSGTQPLIIKCAVYVLLEE